MSTAAVVRHEEPVAVVAPSAQRAMRLLRPVAEPADILAAQEETRQLVQTALKEGRDFGKVPGVDKPSLLKPGAERVSIAFGCVARFRIVDQEVEHDREVRWTKRKKVWNNRFRGDKSFTWGEDTGVSRGLYRYVVECELVHRETGTVVASCVGACSTLESKYVDRPRDSENTALKMAEKRAFVGAVLLGFGLSDQFTQDVEDTVPEPAAAAAPPPPAEPERPMTHEEQLAQARALPLMGKAESWGGMGGKPLGECPVKLLLRARAFFLEKVKERENPRMSEQLEAIGLLLAEEADRSGQESLELPASGAPSDRATAPSAPDAAPAPEERPAALRDEPDDLPF